MAMPSASAAALTSHVDVATRRLRARVDENMAD